MTQESLNEVSDAFIKIEKPKDEGIDEVLKRLQQEIIDTESGMAEQEQLSRLSEVAKAYSGNDKLISFEELEEEIKNDPPAPKMASKITDLDKLLHGGFMTGTVTTLSATPKSGKCLAKGTEVLMFDGSLKKVEDIVVGDKLMGEDSKPKNVLALGSGREEMFKIKQRGAEYTVNKSHILSLKRGAHKLWSRGKPQINKKGTIINMSVGDFIKQTKHFQQKHRGWKTGVDFPKQKTRIDPYFLGLWLGDGTQSSCYITGMDKEVIDYCQEYANKLELELNIIPPKKSRASYFGITRGRRGGMDEFSIQSEMRDMGLLNNKHIPKEYLVNDRETRLKVLAGIIDTDGHLTKNTSPHYDLIQKDKRLVDDIYFLASSLGFHVTVDKCKKGIKSTGFIGDYYRMYISGDFTDVPSLLKRKQYKKPRISKRDVMTSEIKITPQGIGDYFGFELDGNGLFVLGNFVVTHNTSYCMFLTQQMSEFNPMWLALEESAKSLIRKLVNRGMKAPHGYAPKQNPQVSLKWVEAKIIEAVVKFNTKVVFIDQLDFIVPQDSSDRHDLKVAQTMRELHQMAVRWDVAIFLICHLEKMEPDQKPTVKNFRGSSAIWGESDNCILLWRECKREQGELIYTNNVLVMLQANREDGDTGNIKMMYDNGMFLPMDWEDQKFGEFSNYSQGKF